MAVVASYSTNWWQIFGDDFDHLPSRGLPKKRNSRNPQNLRNPVTVTKSTA